jgi:hypothetical protein
MFPVQHIDEQSDGIMQFWRQPLLPSSRTRQLSPVLQPPTHGHSVVTQTPWFVPLIFPEQQTDGQSVSIVQSFLHENVLPSKVMQLEPVAQPAPQPQ